MVRLSEDNQLCDLNGLSLIPGWELLPEDIQKILMPLLGQYLEPNTIPAPDHGRTNVRCFMDPSAIQIYMSARPEMHEIGLFPIAEDDVGSCFCISVQADTLGDVYFWDDDPVVDIGIDRLVVSDSLASFFSLIDYDDS